MPEQYIVKYSKKELEFDDFDDVIEFIYDEDEKDENFELIIIKNKYEKEKRYYIKTT